MTDDGFFAPEDMSTPLELAAKIKTMKTQLKHADDLYIAIMIFKHSRSDESYKEMIESAQDYKRMRP